MSRDALEYFYGITPERFNAMKNTPPPKSTDEVWKERHLLQEQHITQLENRLRALWDKYDGERKHYMERIKRLEEAGDKIVEAGWSVQDWSGMCVVWAKAKEDKL